MREEEMKLHSFTVSVEYEITCYTEEEALACFSSGSENIIHVEDNGEIEWTFSLILIG